MEKFRLTNARRLACASAALALCLLPVEALAQVRTEPAPAALIDPSASAQTRALFERSGLFTVAGGVLPVGHAAFVLEQNGATIPVPATDVRIVSGADGKVALRAGGAEYTVGMPAGLACPLATFVARDGVVAYTVPKYVDQDSRMAMLHAGLVHHRIAREFDGTPFAALLRAADFGEATKLPDALAAQITAGINKANGISGMVIAASDDPAAMVGSYVNSGMQVTYRVYLQARNGRAEIGGVPLRYYWRLEPDGSAGLFAVDMYAQDWAPGARLTDFSVPGSKPTQYDVVNFYQVSALMFQLHESDGADFARFVDQACGKAI
jgi:hypothetical protein